MKYGIVTTILIAATCCALARDEVYVPDGFIGQSVRLLDDNIAIIAVEVSKRPGLEKPVDVRVLDVLHGANALLKLTKVYDDEFDPIFDKKFTIGSKWILRITPRTVKRRKQWVVSYYEASHLPLTDNGVTGNIQKHDEQKKMTYAEFKTLLTKAIEKKKPNKTN